MRPDDWPKMGSHKWLDGADNPDVVRAINNNNTIKREAAETLTYDLYPTCTVLLL